MWAWSAKSYVHVIWCAPAALEASSRALTYVGAQPRLRYLGTHPPSKAAAMREHQKRLSPWCQCGTEVFLSCHVCMWNDLILVSSTKHDFWLHCMPSARLSNTMTNIERRGSDQFISAPPVSPTRSYLIFLSDQYSTRTIRTNLQCCSFRVGFEVLHRYAWCQTFGTSGCLSLI